MLGGDILARHGRALLDASWGDNSTAANIVVILLCIFLVLFSGLLSGLALGLLGMDTLDLEVLRRSGTEVEARRATNVIPLIQDAHFLLVTLLLCNAMAMEALPVFLDKIMTEYAAVMVSVTAVLFVGEIIPQAVCSKYGLAVGSAFSTLVKVLMIVTSPVSFPIAKVLDFALGGEHATLFRRKQLKALVSIHAKEEGFGGRLSLDEIQIITGALDLTRKTAYEAMTPLSKVFMLSCDQKLDSATVAAIMASKPYSRLPVFRGSRNEVVGVVLVKELLQYVKDSPDASIGSMKVRQLPRLSADTPLYDLLKLFRCGAHMALLTQPYPEEDEENVGSGPASNQISRGSTGSIEGSRTLETVPEASGLQVSELPLHSGLKTVDSAAIESESAALLGNKDEHSACGPQRTKSPSNILANFLNAPPRIKAPPMIGTSVAEDADIDEQQPMLRGGSHSTLRLSRDTPFRTAALIANASHESPPVSPDIPGWYSAFHGQAQELPAWMSQNSSASQTQAPMSAPQTCTVPSPDVISMSGFDSHAPSISAEQLGVSSRDPNDSMQDKPGLFRASTFRGLFGMKEAGSAGGSPTMKKKRKKRKQKGKKSPTRLTPAGTPPPERCHDHKNAVSFDGRPVDASHQGSHDLEPPSPRSGLSVAVNRLKSLHHAITGRADSTANAEVQSCAAEDEDDETSSAGYMTSSSGDLEEQEPVPLLAEPGQPIGIITIEDVLEELLGYEIVDETDKWVDNDQSIPVSLSVLENQLPTHLQEVLSVAEHVKNQVTKPADERQAWLLQAAQGVMGGVSGATSTAHSSGQPATSVLAGLANSMLRHAFGADPLRAAMQRIRSEEEGKDVPPSPRRGIESKSLLSHFSRSGGMLSTMPSGGVGIPHLFPSSPHGKLTAFAAAAAKGDLRSELSVQRVGSYTAGYRPNLGSPTKIKTAKSVRPQPKSNKSQENVSAISNDVQRNDIRTATLLAASLSGSGKLATTPSFGGSGRLASARSVVEAQKNNVTGISMPKTAVTAVIGTNQPTNGSSANRQSFANWKQQEQG